MGNYCDEHARMKIKQFGSTAKVTVTELQAGPQGIRDRQLSCSLSGCGKPATKTVMGTPEAPALEAPKPTAPAKPKGG